MPSVAAAAVPDGVSSGLEPDEGDAGDEIGAAGDAGDLGCRRRRCRRCRRRGGRGRRRRGWRGRRRRRGRGRGAGAHSTGEVLHPVDLAVRGSGGTDADRAERRLLDVRLVAGRVEPGVHDVVGVGLAEGDVLALRPACGVAAVGHARERIARDGRCRVVVVEVPVVRHVAGLPGGRVSQRLVVLQAGEPERGAVLIDERDHLLGQRHVRPGPAGAGRARGRRALRAGRVQARESRPP